MSGASAPKARFGAVYATALLTVFDARSRTVTGIEYACPPVSPVSRISWLVPTTGLSAYSSEVSIGPSLSPGKPSVPSLYESM